MRANPFTTLLDDVVGAVNLAELTRGSAVWLAVTGLSRAGKTVFITSLIHNLLSAVHNPNRMPLLKAVGEGRLRSVRLEEAKGDVLPRFPYRSNIEIMADAPSRWPERTVDISEIGVAIRFEPAGLLGHLLSRVGGETATLKLRIVDYPGEWLLDLPLLGQTYAEWSRETLGLWRKGIRAGIAREFFAKLADHRPDEPASDTAAHELHIAYRAMLLAARDHHALSFLQPGRFVCPGAIGELPYLYFVPLDLSERDAPRPGSLAALMAERFEVYKRELVERFYRDYFRQYGRQIVLIDVLGALLAGREAFEDTQQAVTAILQSFRYGQRGILSRLIGTSRVERLLFAATKADHIPDLQRDHLGALLRNMAALPAIDVKSRAADVDVTSIASVASTVDGTQEMDGRTVQVVIGRQVGAQKQAKFFAGQIPIRPPRAANWGTPFLNIPNFEPPAIDPAPVDGIPHINLDLALEFLVGDKLR